MTKTGVRRKSMTPELRQRKERQAQARSEFSASTQCSFRYRQHCVVAGSPSAFSLHATSLFGHQSTPLPHIVPRRFDGKRRIPQQLMHTLFHLTNGPPKPPGGKPVWPVYLEIVRGEFFGSIGSKNFCPRFAPDPLCKRVIIRAQLLLNMPCERGSQSAVTSVSQSPFAKVAGQRDLTAPRLKPGKPLSGLIDGAQYVARHAHRERPNCFVTPDLAISESR